MIGLSEDKVYWGIISTGMINLIATGASLKLVETYGRRPLTLYSLSIITCLMIPLCVFVEIHIRMYSIEIRNVVELNHSSDYFFNFNLNLYQFIRHWTRSYSICISQ